MASQKKGFTIIEIIIIVLLISVGLITVISALQSSNLYLKKTREKIIAINLAREGIEQMFNIRDTNRQRWAGDREKTRLKTNPFVDEGTAGPENDPRFGSGSYILLTNIASGQQYFYALAISGTSGFNINTGLTGVNLTYSLCESGSIRTPCQNQKPKSNEGYFFRRIQGLGIFQKDTPTNGGTYLNCTNGSGTTCGNNNAKEYRFCSIVDYIGNGVGKVELCSVLTNFKQ